MQQGVRVSDVCPLLLSLSPHGRYYRGYLSIDGRDFAFALTLPSSGELKDARIECDWLLAQMLRGKEALLQKLLQESEDEALFLMKLKQILTHTSSSPGAGLAPPPPPRHPAHYTQLLADLDTIGWERVTRVSQDFSQLTITTLRRRRPLRLPVIFPFPSNLHGLQRYYDLYSFYARD
jgi:E3 ubiquitin-protein ligase FANCL